MRIKVVASGGHSTTTGLAKCGQVVGDEGGQYSDTLVLCQFVEIVEVPKSNENANHYTHSVPRNRGGVVGV